jgi:hypothetical protein
MNCLPEIGRGCIERKLGPEGFHDLFPMQRVLGREGQQLHQIGGAPAPPGIA